MLGARFHGAAVVKRRPAGSARSVLVPLAFEFSSKSFDATFEASDARTERSNLFGRPTHRVALDRRLNCRVHEFDHWDIVPLLGHCSHPSASTTPAGRRMLTRDARPALQTKINHQSLYSVPSIASSVLLEKTS